MCERGQEAAVSSSFNLRHCCDDCMHAVGPTHLTLDPRPSPLPWQLSSVFYDRVLMAGVQSGNVAAMVVAFFVWALATLGVLMVRWQAAAGPADTLSLPTVPQQACTLKVNPQECLPCCLFQRSHTSDPLRPQPPIPCLVWPNSHTEPLTPLR